ncbi:MAG TPA: hypothetical protein VL049_22755 [Candidatus Dormibacteraeota bacterium]|nr:hypothetical protein [Candidatus Dormibacteraeota bacterium]
MTACVTERQLIELATGDGDGTTRAHAAACAACAARLAALDRDLSLLRVALRDAPAPVPATVRRRPWLPFAAAAAMAAALLLFTLTPLRTAAPVGVASGEPTTEFGEALASALFADASLDPDEAGADDRNLAAALNGGALCDGAYGDDCSAEVLFASYD